MTVTFERSAHDHAGNAVATARTTGETSEGYVLRGVEHEIDSQLVEGSGIFHLGLTEVWRHPVSKDAFVVHFDLVIDAANDIVRAARYSETCLGA